MDTSASNRRLRILLTGIRSGTLEPRPEFQRRLVWNQKDKNLFIKTVLDGLPFPEIYIAAGKVDSKTGEGSEVLVDGQQRITTLYQYFIGSEDLRLLEQTPAYADLPEDKQIQFLEYSVVVRDLGSLPMDQIKEVFQRINSASYGLNAMELNNARYAGEFKQLAERFAGDELVDELGIFSTNDVRRMNDLRYWVAMLASVLGPYFNRDKEIEGFLSRYDEEVPDKDAIIATGDDALAVIRAMHLTRDSRVAKKSDFFTLFVELFKAIRDGVTPDPEELGRALQSFYALVNGATATDDTDAGKYYRATLQASNDRTSRILRGELVSAIIRGAAK